MSRHLYPLAAIVGQEELKRALLLAAVNPLIGGVLIRGEKGTAKSTAARGLGEILPEVSTPFGPRPAPFRTLPLGATEDRLTGGLDMAEALTRGKRKLAPGLLAETSGGVLYIDEVNLLDDHLVDLIVDSAASGRLKVERDGLSEDVEARFVLVGTMNPEEGEIRPQLLDRFGLSVTMTAELDPANRVELMLRREAFEKSPEDFRSLWSSATDSLKANMLAAKAKLPGVRLPGPIRRLIASLALERFVAGHRADLVMERASAALAAWEGRLAATEADVLAVAPMALSHRERTPGKPQPPEKPRSEPPRNGEDEKAKPPENPEESPPQEPGPEDKPPEDEPVQEERPQDEPTSSGAPSSEDSASKELQEDPTPNEAPPEDESSSAKGQESPAETVFEAGPTFRVTPIQSKLDRLRRRGSGRRSRSRSFQRQGRQVKSGPNLGRGDLAFTATIMAAAPRQAGRAKPPGLAISIAPSDFREAIRERRLGNHLFLTVDASGSMGARGRMAASKGAVMSLLLDAYQKRDQVALISFRRDQAKVSLPLTPSIDLAGKLLAEMPVGGRTPLSSALAVTWREVMNALSKNPLARPIVLLITDGRGNVALTEGAKPLEEAWRLAEVMARDKRVQIIVVDTEEPGAVSFGLAKVLADRLQAVYYKTEGLKAKTLVELIRSQTGP